MGAPSNPVFQEARHTGGYVVWDSSDGMLTREPIILAQGFGLLGAGLVLGQVTATDKYEPYDPTAADGHQSAVAILYAARDTTSADKRAVANVRGPMKVQAAELAWGPNVTTAAQKAAALAQLAALPGGGILSI
ncbi:head decoration protein [Sphingomonas bacterium]|uniref:head decoration protein n=1 Tax=Sphingomonas bacterium TaxID=1895847 RepID=UPI00157671D3|nr:head decoration protein [Sphingomonas bacterium]